MSKGPSKSFRSNTLTIFDGGPGTGPRRAGGRPGVDEAGHGLRVGGVGELRDALDGLAARGATFDRVSFRTQGYPGMIFLGDEEVSAVDLRAAFSGRDHHRLFPGYTRIFFHGYNVARNEAGSGFLRAAGEVFLRGSGGRVSGFTDVGPGLPGWVPLVGGRPIRLLGTRRRLDFGPGGVLLPGPPGRRPGPAPSRARFGVGI